MADHISQSDSEAQGPTRRTFLGQVGAVGLAAATLGKLNLKDGQPEKEVVQSEPEVAGMVDITLKVNGQQHRLKIDPRTTLLDALREHIELTGTKKGCDHGQCGACTVHINGRRANSCLTLALMVEGDEITTIEGIGHPGHLHPMQESFVQCDAYQCGYCTSGQIMSAVALLKEPCGPEDADVKELMSGNICRCGAYQNITEAIQKVRGKR